MRRRLYFIFPDKQQVGMFVKDLLVTRIELKHIHVMGQEGMDLGDLPEASVFQRNDIYHSAFIGLMVGGVIGAISGLVSHYLLGMPLGGALLGLTLTCALFGAWAASMIGIMVPNTHLKRFQQALEAGKILVMVDVQKERVEEIKHLTEQKYGRAEYKGLDPYTPSFP